MRKIDLTGQRFGMLVVQGNAEQPKDCWLCLCDCGKEKVVTANALRSGSTRSCGCMKGNRKKIDLTGQRFTLLVVLGKSEHRKGYWLCHCDCGNEKEISGSSLQRGTSKSCGCMKGRKSKPTSRIEVGQKYGSLTVTGNSWERKGHWFCQCECGKEIVVSGDDLRNGNVKSCGCLLKERWGKKTDLTGLRFGKLEVIKETDRKDKSGTSYWLCHCDCGTEKEILGSSLRNGHTQSCGCLRQRRKRTEI